MEMSKPQEDEKSELTPPTPLKTESAANSVKDLERRLQMMSQAEIKAAPAAAPKPAPMKTAPAAQAAASGGGKNALLVSVFIHLIIHGIIPVSVCFARQGVSRKTFYFCCANILILLHHTKAHGILILFI